MGGSGEYSSCRNHFSLPHSLYEFFLGHSMNIFYGLLACMNFFHLIFPCANIFFGFSPTPPPPIGFLMIHPLGEVCFCGVIRYSQPSLLVLALFVSA